MNACICLFVLWNSRHETSVCVQVCVYLSEVVMYVECGQFGEVSIEAQGHKETCILISQLRALWLVVGNPGWIHLKRQKESLRTRRVCCCVYSRKILCTCRCSAKSCFVLTVETSVCSAAGVQNWARDVMRRWRSSGFRLTCEAGAILSPAATPLWKLGQLVILGGTSIFPLFRSTIVFLGGARPRQTEEINSKIIKNIQYDD